MKKKATKSVGTKLLDQKITNETTSQEDTKTSLKVSHIFLFLSKDQQIMEDTRARAENYGTTLVLQDRVPFDLTQFKQKIRTQDFPLDHY